MKPQRAPVMRTANPQSMHFGDNGRLLTANPKRTQVTESNPPWLAIKRAPDSANREMWEVSLYGRVGG